MCVIFWPNEPTNSNIFSKKLFVLNILLLVHLVKNVSFLHTPIKRKALKIEYFRELRHGMFEIVGRIEPSQMVNVRNIQF